MSEVTTEAVAVALGSLLRALEKSGERREGE